METVTLFHGWNSVQEFWESEERAAPSGAMRSMPRILLLRVKTQPTWSPFVDGYVFGEDLDNGSFVTKGGGTLRGSIEAIVAERGIRIALDPSREWEGSSLVEVAA